MSALDIISSVPPVLGRRLRADLRAGGPTFIQTHWSYRCLECSIVVTSLFFKKKAGGGGAPCASLPTPALAGEPHHLTLESLVKHFLRYTV